MGLIGEYAVYGAVVYIFGAVFCILLVGYAQKLLGGLGVHGVRIGLSVVEGVGHHFLGGEIKHGTPRAAIGFVLCKLLLIGEALTVKLHGKSGDNAVAPGKVLRGTDVKAQIFYAEIRVFGYHSACGAARPAVLVVEPCFHAAFATLFGAGVYKLEPFSAEVFGFKAGAGVTEISAHTHLLHHIYLTLEFFLVKQAVPAPKGLAAKGGAGFFEFFYKPVHIFFRPVFLMAILVCVGFRHGRHRHFNKNTDKMQQLYKSEM